jgi:hypothetical protein
MRGRGSGLFGITMASARSRQPRLAVVNRASMAYLDDQDNKVIVLQPTDDAVVSNSIAPESKFTGLKRLPKIAWISRRRDALPQVVGDLPLDRSIQLLEISKSLFFESNRPGQALSGLPLT